MQLIKIILLVIIFSGIFVNSVKGQKTTIKDSCILVIFDYYTFWKKGVLEDYPLEIMYKKRQTIFSMGIDAEGCVDDFFYDTSKPKIKCFRKLMKKYPVIKVQDINKKIVGKSKIILLEINTQRDTVAYPVTWKRTLYIE